MIWQAKCGYSAVTGRDRSCNRLRPIEGAAIRVRGGNPIKYQGFMP